PQARYALTVNAANAVYGSQILICCGLDGFIAIRRRSGSEWSKWICFTDSNIGDSEDLNNYTNTGVFAQTQNTQAASGTNYPEPYAGMLSVHYNCGIVWQTYLCYSGTNNLYHRGRNSSGNWSNWVKEWDSSDFSQADIDNWNNSVSSTYTRPVDSGAYGLSGASINDLPIGTYTSTLSTNTIDTPFTSVGGLISIGATNAQGTQILGSRTGNELWFRPYSTNYGSWYRLWNSGDFTQTDVSNWDTAFGWGNHTGRYLPLGADIPTNADLDTYLQTGIFIQRFNFQAAAGTNYPVPLKGFLEVLRTPEGLISQKYHVTGGDENNYYIRIFGNSWSSWKKLLNNVD